LKGGRFLATLVKGHILLALMENIIVSLDAPWRVDPSPGPKMGKLRVKPEELLIMPVEN
jgi:hypothetical protein